MDRRAGTVIVFVRTVVIALAVTTACRLCHAHPTGWELATGIAQELALPVLGAAFVILLIVLCIVVIQKRRKD